MAEDEDQDAKMEVLSTTPQGDSETKQPESKPLLSAPGNGDVSAYDEDGRPLGKTSIEAISFNFRSKRIAMIFDKLCNLTYTEVTATIYFVNYFTVTGLVALPYAFYQAGYVASTFIMLWAGMLNYFSFLCASNLMIRAESIVKFALANGR